MSYSKAALLCAMSLSLGSLGCQSAPTQLLVEVDSDYEVPDEVSVLRVELRYGDEARTEDFTFGGGVGEVTGFPLSFGVVPPAESPEARVELELILLDASEGVRVSRVVRSRFQRHRTIRIPVFLARSCEGVVCQQNETCASGRCERIAEPPQDAGGATMDAGGRPDAAHTLDGSEKPIDECARNEDCNNGNACDGVETCDRGACRSGTAVMCSSGTCNPGTGACESGCAESPCRLAAPQCGCAGDEACGVVDESVGCRPFGPRREGETCLNSEAMRCQAGLECVDLPGSGIAMCMRYCLNDVDCRSGTGLYSACAIQLSDAAGSPIERAVLCAPHCVPFFDRRDFERACPDGLACYLAETDDEWHTNCRPRGSGVAGSPCPGGPVECGEGLLCVTESSGRVCRKVCGIALMDIDEDGVPERVSRGCDLERETCGLFVDERGDPSIVIDGIDVGACRPTG